jgi:hypothetical protein
MSSYVERLVHIQALERGAGLAHVEEGAAEHPSAIAPMSVPGSTMAASLPPSSSVRRLSVPAALRMMSWPVRVEPVNTILWMPGWPEIPRPSAAPPATALTRPGGATSSISSTRRRVLSGVSSEGLITTALPARSAGMMCHTAIISGQFHGVIDPTTPSGLRCSSMRLPGRSSITSTGSSSAAVARVHATAPPTSMCASASGLPCSRTMISASSGAFCSMRAATALRAGRGVPRRSCAASWRRLAWRRHRPPGRAGPRWQLGFQ